ncbi:hypothetical protein SAMN02910298_00802 [Pseudobutyrivibrio sp. YE44]|uniref:hypothetical protein n=1 Tax=Pseudobutyrivibrio sp. YE44 TaxID=1520802 RepID=UPI00088996B3|nr:hypothetical protein [Pseudobutyrivibrio sp. YE44]SDB15028.1 hypothetical protein SAMN02910298_00802 [Pseudobutyrivibrio sp. YE44]
MADLAFEEQVKAVGNQLKERINLAISIAVDEDKEFKQAEEVFQEAMTVLSFYNCNDVIVEQLVNFSKVAYCRELFDKALYYAEEAVRKSVAVEGRLTAEENLHSMAYRIFELILVAPERMNGIVEIEEVEDFLKPEDFCFALDNSYNAKKQIRTEDDKVFVSTILKQISLEIMRQGLRYERNGDKEAALKLFRAVMPYLNDKRAELISEEIKKLEV